MSPVGAGKKIKQILYRPDEIEEGDYRSKKLKKRHSLGRTMIALVAPDRLHTEFTVAV